MTPSVLLSRLRLLETRRAAMLARLARLPRHGDAAEALRGLLAEVDGQIQAAKVEMERGRR
jgi:hypothetical protein